MTILRSLALLFFVTLLCSGCNAYWHWFSDTIGADRPVSVATGGPCTLPEYQAGRCVVVQKGN